MSKFETFPCGYCGGRVELARKSGRTRLFRPDVTLQIPADFAIPTCTRCGETYLDAEQSERLDALLKAEYDVIQRQKWSEIVECFRRRHTASQKEIARVLGITPSHLSHILAAHSEPSVSLTRYAEALVACPAEFLRHLKRNEVLLSSLVPRPEYARFESGSSYRARTWKGWTPDVNVAEGRDVA